MNFLTVSFSYRFWKYRIIETQNIMPFRIYNIYVMSNKGVDYQPALPYYEVRK